MLPFLPLLHLCAGLKVIRKKLVRKAIDMIKKLADGQDRALKELEEKDAAKGGWNVYSRGCFECAKGMEREAGLGRDAEGCRVGK